MNIAAKFNRAEAPQAPGARVSTRPNARPIPMSDPNQSSVPAGPFARTEVHALVFGHFACRNTCLRFLVGMTSNRQELKPKTAAFLSSNDAPAFALSSGERVRGEGGRSLHFAALCRRRILAPEPKIGDTAGTPDRVFAGARKEMRKGPPSPRPSPPGRGRTVCRPCGCLDARQRSFAGIRRNRKVIEAIRPASIQNVQTPVRGPNSALRFSV